MLVTSLGLLLGLGCNQPEPPQLPEQYDGVTLLQLPVGSSAALEAFELELRSDVVGFATMGEAIEVRGVRFLRFTVDEVIHDSAGSVVPGANAPSLPAFACVDPFLPEPTKPEFRPGARVIAYLNRGADGGWRLRSLEDFAVGTEATRARQIRRFFATIDAADADDPAARYRALIMAPRDPDGTFLVDYAVYSGIYFRPSEHALPALTEHVQRVAVMLAQSPSVADADAWARELALYLNLREIEPLRPALRRALVSALPSVSQPVRRYLRERLRSRYR
ncbi:MAG: hypothetical protein Tsb0020_51680 [Haliangiales bacterium]